MGGTYPSPYPGPTYELRKRIATAVSGSYRDPFDGVGSCRDIPSTVDKGTLDEELPRETTTYEIPVGRLRPR